MTQDDDITKTKEVIIDYLEKIINNDERILLCMISAREPITFDCNSGSIDYQTEFDLRVASNQLILEGDVEIYKNRKKFRESIKVTKELKSVSDCTIPGVRELVELFSKLTFIKDIVNKGGNFSFGLAHDDKEHLYSFILSPTDGHVYLAQGRDAAEAVLNGSFSSSAERCW